MQDEQSGEARSRLPGLGRIAARTCIAVGFLAVGWFALSGTASAETPLPEPVPLVTSASSAPNTAPTLVARPATPVVRRVKTGDGAQLARTPAPVAPSAVVKLPVVSSLASRAVLILPGAQLLHPVLAPVTQVLAPVTRPLVPIVTPVPQVSAPVVVPDAEVLAPVRIPVSHVRPPPVLNAATPDAAPALVSASPTAVLRAPYERIASSTVASAAEFITARTTVGDSMLQGASPATTAAVRQSEASVGARDGAPLAPPALPCSTPTGSASVTGGGSAPLLGTMLQTSALPQSTMVSRASFVEDASLLARSDEPGSSPD